MKHVITVPESVEGVTVDLWGTEFETRPPTKSLAKRCEPHIIAMLEATTNDELVDAIAAFYDEKLVPTGGRRTKPSTLIRRKWDDDAVTIPQLQALGDRLRDAEHPI